MAQIEKITGIEILDSRGNPSIECVCYLDNGIMSTASAPSGASTGSYEAFELRDNIANIYNGKGVTQCLSHIETIISPALVGMDVSRQEEIDNILIKLDNTSNLSNLGGNTCIAVSTAVLKAAAAHHKKPLYAFLDTML